MKNILCFGDSNTFGVNPEFDGTEESPFRWDRDTRWPGRLQTLLGDGYHIIEEGLGGRTFSWDDQTVAGRNALRTIFPILQSHEPLDLIIIMLGTNDLKGVYQASVMEIGRGLDALLRICKNPFTYEVSKIPQVLVVSPVHLGEDIDRSWLRGVFDEYALEKSRLLAKELEQVAQKYNCLFFDAASVAKASPIDSVHMGKESHAALALAIQDIIVRSC